MYTCRTMEKQQNQIIRLNVGGVIHTTTRTTLCTYPESMLGAMFSGDFGANVDENGHYFIDRDGEIFKHVLNFLRSNRITLPEDFTEWDLLLSEADFYQIQPMIDALKSVRIEKLTANEGKHLSLEIFEVRSDINKFTPSRSTLIRTVAIGRKEVLLSLPTTVALEQEFTELEADKKKEFGELQLHGRTVRSQLMVFLNDNGWKQEKSEMSSSSASHGRDLYIEQSIREVWTKNALE